MPLNQYEPTDQSSKVAKGKILQVHPNIDATANTGWPLVFPVRPYTVGFIQISNEILVAGGGSAGTITYYKSLTGKLSDLGTGVTLSTATGTMTTKIDLEAVNYLILELTTPATYSKQIINVNLSLAISEESWLTQRR